MEKMMKKHVEEAAAAGEVGAGADCKNSEDRRPEQSAAAAEVEPAKVKKIVQSLSSIIWLNMFAAFAVSLETKDIFAIEEIIFLASNEAISMCSTSLLRKSFLLL